MFLFTQFGPALAALVVTTRCKLALWAYHEDGTVGVPNNRVGDATHEGSPYSAPTPAAHHDKAGPDLFCLVYDLGVRAARAKVRASYLSPLGLDRTYQLLKPLSHALL